VINIFEQVLYKLAKKAVTIDQLDQGLYNDYSIEIVAICNKNAMLLEEKDLYEILQMLEDEANGIKRLHEYVIRSPKDFTPCKGYKDQAFNFVKLKKNG